MVALSIGRAWASLWDSSEGLGQGEDRLPLLPLALGSCKTHTFKGSWAAQCTGSFGSPVGWKVREGHSPASARGLAGCAAPGSNDRPTSRPGGA